MKTRIMILLLFIFSDLLNVSGQVKQIELRYKEKEHGFLKYLSKNLKYPDESATNKVTGYSVTGITITPQGEIKNINIINSLDKNIDDQITTALSKTKGKWIKSDSIKTDETFYVQVIYRIESSDAAPSQDPPLKDIFNFIEPITVTSKASKEEGIETSESIGTKIAECLKSNKSDESIKYIDELIRRNPFNKNLYQLKASINKKLGRNDIAEKDLQKLQNFIPGVPLEDFLAAFAQQNERLASISKAKQQAEIIRKASEVKPEFYGGKEAIARFVSQNLKYPPSAYQMRIEGFVYVRFLIRKDGTVTDAKITKSVHPELDEEALRIVRLMPVWRPGLLDGKPVNVYFTLPIRFSIN